MTRKIILVLVAVLILGAATASSQPVEEGSEGPLPLRTATERIGTKIAVVLLFSAVTAAVILTKRFKYRKWINLASVIILGFVLGSVLSPSNAVQTALVLFSTAFLVLFLIPLVLTLFFGRAYCGYICPVGSLQELVNFGKARKKVPQKLDRFLKYVKYALLLFVGILTIARGQPVGNMSMITPLFTFTGVAAAFVASIGLLGLSVFYNRPYCRYVCPYGALMALISKLSVVKVRVDHSCIDCKLCDRECGMKAIRSGHADQDCIMCGDCVEVCPKDSLEMRRKL